MWDIDRLARVAVSDSFIAGLPKVELHVHHVGSVPLRAVAELAARHPGTVPSDLDELARYFIFEDFPHFIRNYLAVVDLIKTAEDMRLITYEVAADMVAQNIRYAELTVTPYISISDSLPAEAFLEAIEDARQAAHRDHGLELWWIFDIPADFGVPAAELTASVALDHDVLDWSGSDSVGRTAAFHARCFVISSIGLARPDCGACRMPVRPPVPKASGTPWSVSVRNASSMALPRSATRVFWNT